MSASSAVGEQPVIRTLHLLPPLERMRPSSLPRQLSPVRDEQEAVCSIFAHFIEPTI